MVFATDRKELEISAFFSSRNVAEVMTSVEIISTFIVFPQIKRYIIGCPFVLGSFLLSSLYVFKENSERI